MNKTMCGLTIVQFVDFELAVALLGAAPQRDLGNVAALHATAIAASLGQQLLRTPCAAHLRNRTFSPLKMYWRLMRNGLLLQFES